MTQLAIHPILLLICTLIAIGCSLTLALQLRRGKKNLSPCQTELTHITSTLDSTKSREPEEKPRPTEFIKTLEQATLKQRLEKGPAWRQPPEKYRYASALADQGMDAAGIAAVLQFPIEAAQQLIALKRAAQIDPATTQSDK